LLGYDDGRLCVTSAADSIAGFGIHILTKVSKRAVGVVVEARSPVTAVEVLSEAENGGKELPAGSNGAYPRELRVVKQLVSLRDQCPVGVDLIIVIR